MKKPIQRQPAAYQPLPGIRDPIIQREFRGVNKLDAFSIDDQFATDMLNLTSDAYPALTTRPGYSVLGDTVDSKVLGLGVWKDRELHAVFGDGTWRKWDGTSWVTLTSGLNTSAEWSFTNIKGAFNDVNLIGSNGVDPAKRYDGSTIQNVATAPIGIDFVEQYADRLYGAVSNTLHFTAYRVGDDWTSAPSDATASGWIVVETNDGKPITSVKHGIGHMTVFKEDSIHELFGYSPDDYRLIPADSKVGAVNNKSVINRGGTLYFIHTTGIYSYQGGTAPSNTFSLPVQKYIDEMDTTNLAVISAGTDGKKMYFSIPGKILVYDPQYKVWSVWGDISPNNISSWKNNLYIGDNLGRVLRLGGTTDNGAPIKWEWVSKPFNGGSLAQKLRWYRLWNVADVPIGSLFNIHLSKQAEGNNDWVLAQTVNGSASIQSARTIIPVDTVAQANWIRVKFAGEGPMKIHEFTRQQREMPIT